MLRHRYNIWTYSTVYLSNWYVYQVCTERPLHLGRGKTDHSASHRQDGSRMQWGKVLMSIGLVSNNNRKVSYIVSFRPGTADFPIALQTKTYFIVFVKIYCSDIKLNVHTTTKFKIQSLTSLERRDEHENYSGEKEVARTPTGCTSNKAACLRA